MHKNTEIVVLPAWQEVRFASRITQYSLLSVQTTMCLELWFIHINYNSGVFRENNKHIYEQFKK